MRQIFSFFYLRVKVLLAPLAVLGRICLATAYLLALPNASTRAADVTSTWNGAAANWSSLNWTNLPAMDQFPNNGNGGFTYDAIITSGAVAVDQNIQIQELTLSGGSLDTTSHVLTLNESFNWIGNLTASQLVGAGHLAVSSGGTLSIGDTGGADHALNSTLINNGTGSWTGASKILMTAGTLQNNGSFTADSNITLSATGQGGTNSFNNSGAFVKYGSGLAQFNTGSAPLVFNNSGTVDVKSGTLALLAGGTHTGDFTGASGAKLQFGGSHTFAAASDINGDLDVIFSGSTGTIDNGSVATTGTVTFNASAVFVSQTMNGPLTAGTLNVSTGRAILNGPLNAGSGNITGGTLDGATDWNVSGALNWTGGTVQGAGQIVIGSGGQLSVSNPGTITLRRRLVNNGAATWTGTVGDWNMNAATIENNGSFIANLAGSTGTTGFVNVNAQAGTNVVNNAGSFTKIGQGKLIFRSGVSFNNSGSVNVQQGELLLQGGGTHTGAFTGSSGATLAFAGGVHNLSSSSQIIGALNVSMFDTVADGAIAITGDLVVGGGIKLGGSTLNSAVAARSLTVGSGFATFNGSLNVPGGGITGGGMFGSANWNVTGTLDWTGGTMEGTGVTTIAQGAVLNLRSPILGRNLINNGTTNWNGDQIFLRSSLTGTFQNNGTFIANFSGPNFQDLYGGDSSGGGVATFNNAGIFTKIGTGTTNLSSYIGGGTLNVSNTGVIDVQAGTFRVDSNVALAQHVASQLTGGTWIVRSNATFELAGGANITTSFANVTLEGPGSTFARMDSLTDNRGSFAIVNGRNFTANGPFSNAGTMTIGAGSAFTASINYTQLASGSLRIDLGGTTRGSEYGALVTSGQLTLDGTLAVSLTNGFAPAAGNSFDIVDWATLSGTFATLQLPTLNSGLHWDVSQLYTTGTIFVTAPASIPGDFNDNGRVDAADYVVWRKNFGLSSGATSSYGDGDSDGDVDGEDYLIWQRNFGQTSGAESAAFANIAVPEPATNCIAVLAFAMLALTQIGRELHTSRKTTLRARLLVRQSIVIVGAAFIVLHGTCLTRADIYQWEWVDPNDHSLGKQQSSILCPDGAGFYASYSSDFSNRNLTGAWIPGLNLLTHR